MWDKLDICEGDLLTFRKGSDVVRVSCTPAEVATATPGSRRHFRAPIPHVRRIMGMIWIMLIGIIVKKIDGWSEPGSAEPPNP